VMGVESNGELIDCDVVVIATGARSARLEGLPRDLPVRPVRGQMLALRPTNPLFGRTLAGADVYAVPRPDGRVIIGSTMEEVGFDASTTADALETLRAAAVRLVPRLAGAAEAGAWAGFRPATPDDLPLLGADPEVSGLFYATGHFRNGILLTPVTADAVSAAIVGEIDIDLSPYSIARFEHPASDVRRPASGSVTRATQQTCDLCGAPMYEVHCKVICRTCGYKRDCSDLW
jgi:glycine oxidase